MKRYLPYIGVLVIALLSARMLFLPGLFPTHDDTHPARVVTMGRALAAGTFPVRWVPDLGYGYGYPLYNFYGPLPYYLGGALSAAGVDPLVSVKSVFVIGTILAAFSMYLLASRFFGPWGGVVAAAAYQFAPYHAVQIFVRGAVGEYWATAFLPLVLLGFLLAADGDSRVKGVFLGALGLAAVILSHTISGFLAAGFLVIATVLYWTVKGIRHEFSLKGLLFHVCILIIGLDLSAFFWLPALFEMRFTDVARTVGGTADFRLHFVCPAQLWDSPWGFGGSAPGCVDGMSFKLGKVQILLAAAAAAAAAVGIVKTNRPQKRALYAGAMAAVLGIFGSVSASSFVWQAVPFTSFVQYPWRLLPFALMGISLLAAPIGLLRGKPWMVPVLSGIAIAATVIVNAKLFFPAYTYRVDAKTLESPYEISWRASKESDEYLPKGFPLPKNFTDIAHGPVRSAPGLAVREVRDRVTSVTVSVTADRETRVVIQRPVFPGWTYFLDGKKAVTAVEGGLPVMIVSEGNHEIGMRFTDTQPRISGNLLSFTTIVLICLLFYGKKTIT